MKIDLQALALAGQMIPDAPIEASRSVVIEAPVTMVWQLLINVSDWSRWYAYLKNARLNGAFAPGAKLTYGGIIKHRLAIAKVQHHRLVMIYGTLTGYTAITRWDIEVITDTQTKVAFTESSAGPLIASLYGRERLGAHLAQWLASLKEEAERR